MKCACSYLRQNTHRLRRRSYWGGPANVLLVGEHEASSAAGMKTQNNTLPLRCCLLFNVCVGAHRSPMCTRAPSWALQNSLASDQVLAVSSIQ